MISKLSSWNIKSGGKGRGVSFQKSTQLTALQSFILLVILICAMAQVLAHCLLQWMCVQLIDRRVLCAVRTLNWAVRERERERLGEFYSPALNNFEKQPKNTPYFFRHQYYAEQCLFFSQV